MGWGVELVLVGIGGVVLLLLLGMVGAFRSADRREEAARAHAEGRLTEEESSASDRVNKSAFAPARWWEWGKARDQKAYRIALDRGELYMARMHILVGNEKKRMQRRATLRTVALTAAIIVGIGFAFAPRETVRVLELSVRPVGAFALGALLLVATRKIDKVPGGVGVLFTQGVLAVAGFGALLIGFLFTVIALFEW